MADIKSLQLNTHHDDQVGAEKLSKKKNNRKKINRLLFLAVVALFVGAFFWKNPTTTSVLRYVTGQRSSLQIENGKVNVLLLGMAGGTHDGANLTDTIIIASFDIKTNTVSLISLPRDLWLENAKSKVNALYEKKSDGNSGLKYAEENFGYIVGFNIPYAVRMDFSGFIKAIDLLDGIDVMVANSFDDYIYPVEGKENDYCGLSEKMMDLSESQAKELGVQSGSHQVLIAEDSKIVAASIEVGGKISYSEDNVATYFPCRYEHISFKKGLMHLDGTTALKFVRSRHGTDNEGSDFARSRRQQLVLQAFKQKVLSLGTLTNINKITGLIKTFGDSVETDIPESQYLELASLIKGTQEVRSTVLSSEGKNPLLVNPPVSDYGAWVLIPPSNDFTAIHNHLNDFINQIDTSTKSAQIKTTAP
ncbi:MAG: LCP family protein [Candidatus Daviesbacteria bacterium]|nr:LCP family protein [Candidatus Daviesbacteria bacterium]